MQWFILWSNPICGSPISTHRCGWIRVREAYPPLTILFSLTAFPFLWAKAIFSTDKLKQFYRGYIWSKSTSFSKFYECTVNWWSSEVFGAKFRLWQVTKRTWSKVIKKPLWIDKAFPFTSDKPHYENVPFEVPSSWVWSTVNEINMYNSKNVDPAKQKENTFELYSVPIFPTNTPEIIKGEKLVLQNKA